MAPFTCYHPAVETRHGCQIAITPHCAHVYICIYKFIDVGLGCYVDSKLCTQVYRARNGAPKPICTLQLEWKYH